MLVRIFCYKFYYICFIKIYSIYFSYIFIFELYRYLNVASSLFINCLKLPEGALYKLKTIA
jgi:hypothetical protein